MFRSRSFSLALAMATLCASISSQSALCFGPDGLTGPCCSAAGLNLPAGLPPLTLPGLAPAWLNCQPLSPPTVVVQVAAPIPTARCGEYNALLTIDDAAGNSVLAGTMVLDYTRTWGETTDANADPELQVWRFAAKVDLGGLAAFTSTPACVGPTPSAFYYGYVDYAQRCAGTWEGVVVLFHGCDRFMHDPVLSSAPGAFHPGSSYAVVAPSTAANPFNVQNVPPIGGVLNDEGMRTLQAPGLACETEERSAAGNLTTLARGCACRIGPASRQQSIARFAASGTCPDAGGNPGSWQALNTGPWGLPWLRLVTTSIGNWTTASSYPGIEQAAVSEGVFEYHESCANGGQGQSFIDIFYGASTSGGFLLAVPAGVPQPNGMVDLASNFAAAFGAPLAGPFLGEVLDTRHLIYTNVY